MQTELLPLASIIISDRIRGVDDELDDLCDSLVRFGGEPRGMLQPPIIDQNNVLQDGFRRYSAAKKLGWTMLPVHRREALTDAEYFEVELETNFRRRQFTWKELIDAVVKVHKTRKREAALRNESWTLAMTGELLGGYGDSYVSNCLNLAPQLSNEAFSACDSITDAVRVMYRLKLDAATAELVKRTALTPQTQPLQTPQQTTTIGEVATPKPNGEPQDFIVNLSSTLFLGDSVRDVLPLWPDACVDHIITDPPYAIDVANMQQDSTSLLDTTRVAETHNVEENLALFKLMFTQFYRVMKDDRFLVLWCDEEQRHTLKELAIASGFKVQRWSHVWVKTSLCKNQMAHVNETKSTEIALVCRKGNAVLPAPTPNNFTVCPNDAERISNPFAKPEALWSDLLNRFTIVGQTILDPFAGEGSCPLTAIKLHRPILAIEKDPTHFNYMVEGVKSHWKSVNPAVKFI